MPLVKVRDGDGTEQSQPVKSELTFQQVFFSTHC